MGSSGKILVLSNSFTRSQDAINLLTEKGWQIEIPPQLDANEKGNWIKNALAKASAVIVGHDHIDRSLIETSPLLKVIAKQGVGTDSIDINAAKEKGIKIVTAAGANSESVADLAFLLMLAVSRQLIPANIMVKDGGWDRVFGHEVWNKNLGIIGFGEIGQRVAHRAKGFSMKISYYDIIEHKEAEQLIGATRKELSELMSWADFISIHLPLNAHTAGTINGNLLSVMKPSAYLINTSRGGVIDEVALLKALIDHKIAGAGLDVFVDEPLKDLTIAQLPNVVATPHMAAYTFEATERVSIQVANSILEALEPK